MVDAPAQQDAVSTGGSPIAVTWGDPNTPTGPTITGGQAPYTTSYSPKNPGDLFSVGTTTITVSVDSNDGQHASDTFDVVVTTPTPPPTPDPLVAEAPANVPVLSLDGNPVAASWDDATALGGVQPYTYAYTESGVPKTSGVSTFAVGVHTIVVTVTDSAAPPVQDTDSFTITVNAASAGAIAELRDTHPRLGVTDVATLRTRVTNASYGEKALLQQIIDALPTKLQTSALALATPYTSLSTSATARNAAILWGAMNCAYLALLDPAQLRSAGMTTSTGFPFSTASGRTISATCTAADLADLAYDLMTQYQVTNAVTGANAQPYKDLIASGKMRGISAALQHEYSHDDCETLYAHFALTYDWCYNLWSSAQRQAFCDAVNAAFVTKVFSTNGTGTTYVADSTVVNVATTVAYDNGWWNGNQQAWHWAMRPLIYLAMLNDLEFGTEAEQLAVWAHVQPRVNRVASEMSVYGGNGYNHIEAMIRYGTDTWCQLLTLAMLSRSAYLSDDPWDQCEQNVTGIAHCLALLQWENERGSSRYTVVPRIHTVSGTPDLQSDGSSILYLARSTLLAWGLEDDAETAQWLLESVGQEPASPLSTANYRWAQAVLRHGLLAPYRHLAPASAPASWRRSHSGGGWVFFGDPATADEPQLIIADAPMSFPSGHSASWVCTFALACGGQLVPFMPIEVKGGPFETSGSENRKREFSSEVILRDATTKARVSRGSGIAPSVAAPYNSLSNALAQQEYIRADASDYGFVQTEWRRCYDDNTTNLTGAKRFYVYLMAIRCVVVVDLVEGLPAGLETLNRIWITAEPTWIGGSQAEVPAGTTVNGFQSWKSSTDATGWSVTNDSGGAIAAVTNEVNAQSATHGKMYVTPLLPATKDLHARGGADWLTATAIFQEFQTADDTGAAYTVVKKPGTAARTTNSERDHAWGRLEVRGGTTTNQRFMTVYQFGHSGSGDPYYVGSRIAVALIADAGGDVDICHIPHASTPWAVVTPRTTAKTNVDSTYSFVLPVPLTTKLLLTGLPVSAAVGVSGSAGGGNVTVTVAASGAFTSTAQGTLLVTVATNGAIS